MLGTVGPDLNQTCKDGGFWYRIMHPIDCAGTGDATGISAEVVNTAPVAPVTVGAMTVQGVWTPDYAMQRTQSEVDINLASIGAAADARNLTGQYEGGTGLPFGDPSQPDSSNGLSWLTLVAIGAIGLVVVKGI